MDSSLLPFFSPRGVVIVGASTEPTKLGYGVARNLVQSGYKGAVHLVNPKNGTLFGQTMVASIAKAPDPVDLAVLIVPAAAIPKAIADCGARGIHAAIIASGGFREIGPEGAALEAECVRVAREYRVRLLGPNCIGLLDTHLPLDTTFLPPPPPAPGDIAFLSHSGAFCAAVIDWSRQQGFSFSRLVSLGNQADITETDLLEITAADENSHVLALYIESLPDGRRFIDEARRVTRRKPIVALKVGRFASGQKAAASHTGALAGSEAAYDAAFEKAGVLRAQSTEDLFEWSRALAWLPLPAGRKMAVLTNAGGPGVMAADSLEANGLPLAELSSSTLATLRGLLPPAASLNNPIDMLSSASPSQYAACLSALLADEGVDGVLVILPPPPTYSAESVADALIPLIKASSKPVTVALMGSNLVQEAYRRLNAARIPTYDFPERAASALSALARRAEFLTTEHTESTETPKKFSVVNSSTDELITAYGIPTVPMKLARSADEAASLAEELGFPVVLKIASPDILHKSDVGGVLINQKTKSEVLTGYAQMTERVKAARPEARIEGVYLQKQIPQGQEVILGATRDPQFGPLMMFGSGGVEVEGLKDVAFALAPLNEREAEQMIVRTWAGRKLAGFRNIPAADREAVIDALIRLSWLAYEHQEIEEIEINPLRVLSQGAVAVDVRMKFTNQGGTK